MNDDYKLFVMKFLIGVMLLASAIFGLNAYIDPLWYFGGNRYSGINYTVNERLSKLNLYLKSPGSYDCIIFGSSGVTLLDPSLFKYHHCFNFSSSAGNVLDFIDYAKYIKALGVQPQLIIVGVDLFDFQSNKLKSDAPAEVKKLTSPPSALTTYLSWDAVALSIKTIRGQASTPRNYDKNFKGIILTQLLSPQSVKYMQDQIFRSPDSFVSTTEPATTDNIRYYQELRDIFSHSEYVGYVPHRSPRLMAKIESQGHLDSALEVIYQVSKVFDRFYDFSIPSEVTTNSSDTYDGLHFGPDTTRHIAEEINGDTQTPWLHLHEETYEQYRSDYRHRLDEYITKEPQKS
jgi:hypothetical protein